MNIQIEQFFIGIGDLKQSHGKWYNGQSYFPYTKYYCTVDSEFDQANIHIYYKYLENQFINKDVLGDDSGLDRHIVQIEVHFPKDIDGFTFEISSPSFFTKIISQQKIRVNANTPEFKRFLESDEALKRIFKLSEESSHFDPILKGETKEERFRVMINYNTSLFNTETINNMLQFISELERYLTQ